MVKKRWRFGFGVLPQTLVAITGIVCAVVVWPSDLSWACIAIAGLATVLMGDWQMEFGE